MLDDLTWLKLPHPFILASHGVTSDEESEKVQE